MIVENKNIRYMKFKEPRAILRTQKYPKIAVEKEIIEAVEIHQEKLRDVKNL